MADVALKQGDTFVADCVYTDADGVPVNLTIAGIAIKSAIRGSNGKNRIELPVIIAASQEDSPGVYSIEADTTAWPVGSCVWDIRYYQNGRSFSTRSISIQVSEKIT